MLKPVNSNIMISVVFIAIITIIVIITVVIAITVGAVLNKALYFVTTIIIVLVNINV